MNLKKQIPMKRLAARLSSTAFELANTVKQGVLEGGLNVLERIEKELNSFKVYDWDRKNI